MTHRELIIAAAAQVGIRANEALELYEMANRIHAFPKVCGGLDDAFPIDAETHKRALKAIGAGLVALKDSRLEGMTEHQWMEVFARHGVTQHEN